MKNKSTSTTTLLRLLLSAIFIVFLSTQFCFAQDDLYKKMAQETCDCISKQDIAGKSKTEVEGALGICMLEVIQKNKLDIDISDESQMEKFGEKIGVLMAPICPSVFKVFIDNTDESAQEKITELEGNIKSIETSSFLYIILKDNGGNEQRLVWLSYFEGSDEFATDPNKLIGKSVKLKYRTSQYYIPKSKGYMSVKEIVELKTK